MATIAVYSAKGGVGKTTLAVNLAWMSAARSKRRTLLWDLDAQAASTYVLARKTAKAEAREVMERDVDPAKAIVATDVPGLDVLVADPSIRALDAIFAQMDKKKRLRKLLDDLGRDYDRILLDCPPGLGMTTDQLIRAADLIVTPMIPSTLSRRGYDDMRAYLTEQKARSAVMPVFNMADRRRLAHRDAIAGEPDWPVIPMASAAEQMAERRMPIGAYAPRSPAATAIAELWTRIERTLVETSK